MLSQLWMLMMHALIISVRRQVNKTFYTTSFCWKILLLNLVWTFFKFWNYQRGEIFTDNFDLWVFYYPVTSFLIALGWTNDKNNKFKQSVSWELLKEMAYMPWSNQLCFQPCTIMIRLCSISVDSLYSTWSLDTNFWLL